MAIRSATPYLLLGGKAEEAISLYERALGAELEELLRFGDVDRSCSEAVKARVMNATLRIGAARLMLSDGPGDAPPDSGKVSVALDLTDREQTRRSFDMLAEAGKVIEHLFDAPWGAYFGVVQDPFGVTWMFHCATSTADSA
ncbi:MAG: VOC family protein [Myxococcota bacterium]